jgi:hypothetical protein
MRREPALRPDAPTSRRTNDHRESAAETFVGGVRSRAQPGPASIGMASEGLMLATSPDAMRPSLPSRDSERFSSVAVVHQEVRFASLLVFTRNEPLAFGVYRGVSTFA